MPASVSVMPQRARAQAIAREIASPKRLVPFTFRGQRISLPVVRLAIDLPLYRMENGRTSVEQLDYLRNNTGQPHDFFTLGEENVPAQRVQHAILTQMSKDEKGPIYQELQRSGVQEEPLLLTATGVTVNGNRRLAAMRELYAADPAAFPEFSHADAAVLPDNATPEDLEVIETELQMAVETKLEYTWIDQRLKLKSLVDHYGFSAERIAQVMHFQNANEVKDRLRQLALVDEYLETYLRDPGNYKAVSTGEQLFSNLTTALRRKTGPDLETAKLIAFTLVKEAGQLGTRAYDFREAFGTLSAKVATQLAVAYREQTPTAVPGQAASGLAAPASPSTSSDPLDALAQPVDAEAAFVTSSLSDQSRTLENARLIASIHRSLKEEERQENTRGRALDLATKANTSLASIDLVQADESTLPQLRNQLVSAQSHAATILRQIDDLLSP